MSSSPARMGRVAYVIGTLDVGGAERQLLELATRLSRERWDPVVYSFVPGGALEEAFGRSGISVHPLRPWVSPDASHGALRRAISGTYTAARLRAELGRSRPDILHAFLPEACAVAAAAAPRGVPLVVSKRSLRASIYRNPWAPWIERFSNRHAARIVVNSKAVAQDVEAKEGAPSRKLRLVYNGVDVDRFVPASFRRSGPVRVGMLANFIPYKGQSLAIEAFSRVAPSFEAEFVLWGRGGPYLEECRRQSQALGVVDKVHFPGPAKDSAEALRDLDLLISASTEEGFSNSILEAMATGLPIVATAVGGTPEQLEDGRTGLVIPSGDLDALAEALRRLIGDDGLRRRLGENARTEVSHRFSMAAMVAGTESVYDELLSWPAAEPAGRQTGS